MSNYKNECYPSRGKIQKLVIFIHGYNGSPEAIDYAVQSLVNKLENAVVCVPRAPHICEKNSENLQWFSLFEYDPDAKFRNPQTSTPEIFDIFQHYGESAFQTAQNLNDFIDTIQQKYGIDDDHTYVCGFSQGAMLSAYTSLTRHKKIAGCIMIAGIIPGMNSFASRILSKPLMLLLHGEDDQTVQYKTLPTTVNWLLENHLDLRIHTYPNLAHQMNDAEMQQAADFINFGKR